MKIIPKPKVKKSASARKADKYYEEKGISDASRKRYYKVKVKATDPGARAGKAKSIKMTEISEKKAEKLKAKNPRKDVENPGKLAQNVSKSTGLTELERYKGSKVANAKSNLNLKGKAMAAVLGKDKVGQMEAKKPGNQYEKGTTGKQMYVGTQEPEMQPVKKIEPKKLQRNDADFSQEKREITPIQYSGRTEESAEKTQSVNKKPATTGGMGTKKTPAGGNKVRMSAGPKKASGKKYYVNIGGQEKQVTEEEAKGRYKNFFKK